LKGFGGEWREVILKDIFDRVTRKNEEHNTNVVTISAQRGFVRQIEQSNIESVKLRGKFIVVKTSDKSNTKNFVKEWYLKHAKSKFHAIASPLIDKFKKYKVEPDSIVLREMPTRWGSCTPKGKIILNPELIKAPKGCIEYVIIHELCHLIHHDHTQRFIDLQTKEMPDWEKWKSKLEILLA
jgi:hypothetical protein